MAHPHASQAFEAGVLKKNMASNNRKDLVDIWYEVVLRLVTNCLIKSISDGVLVAMMPDRRSFNFPSEIFRSKRIEGRANTLSRFISCKSRRANPYS